MKYFTKEAMSKRIQTFHGVAESLASRPQFKTGYDAIQKAFKEAGTGPLAGRAEQSASLIPHLDAQALLNKTRKIEKSYNRATRKPALSRQAMDNLHDAKFNYDHGTKFIVVKDGAKVLASFAKGPREKTRAINTVTVGDANWKPLTKDKITGRKLDPPVDLTHVFFPK